jgi:hypothetical protein
MLAGAHVGVGGVTAMQAEPSAPPPTLEYVFSVEVEVAPPVEQGIIVGARRRFIAITGGRVHGPRLSGVVMPGGGDWQAIHSDGLTLLEARYFLKADDGTVIEVTNPGVRAAAPDVIDRLARGEDVDPAAYYFRSTPQFGVPAGPHAWLCRKVFVARAIRKPERIVIDFYSVE